jgi:hypothetical protein
LVEWREMHWAGKRVDRTDKRQAAQKAVCWDIQMAVWLAGWKAEKRVFAMVEGKADQRVVLKALWRVFQWAALKAGGWDVLTAA